MEAVCVKEEPEREPVVVKDEPEWKPGASARGVSEAVTQAGLYVDHVVKDEVVLGPELLQPRDSVFALRASLQTENSHLSSLKTKEEPGRTCSVERMHLDPEHGTYRIDDRFIQHGVKYFTCKECHYVTQYAHNFQCHLRTHTGEKPFKCNQCSSKFKQQSHLLTHQRTHTGEKPFKCNQCSSNFKQKAHLLRHQRTHTGEKPFECNQCSSKFKQRCHLLTHQRTHTGEKPFKCDQCSSAFAHRTSLIYHQGTHT